MKIEQGSRISVAHDTHPLGAEGVLFLHVIGYLLCAGNRRNRSATNSLAKIILAILVKKLGNDCALTIRWG